MPSSFLQKRHAKFLEEIAGTDTVSYIRYDPDAASVARDEITGDVMDEDQAYAADPIALPALVDLSPSEAMREKVGLKIDFDALLRVPTSCLDDNSISAKIGDAFILPGSVKKYYVKKIVRNMQSDSDFLEVWFAVSRKVGR